MFDSSKQIWLEFIETFIEMRLLWDPKHEHYTNKAYRAVAYEELLEKYQKITDDATLVGMKKKIDNMRTAYNRERKKVNESIQRGELHTPTLWYYDHFSRMDASDKEDIPKYDTLKHFVKRGCKRNVTSTPISVQSSERIRELLPKDADTDTQSPQPKRRIYHLLQKQEKFVEAASKMLVAKNAEWEIQGKAIGQQISKLDKMQKTIANKLIADVIYYGSLGKLSTDSYIHIEDYQELLPEFEKEINSESENQLPEDSEEVFCINNETPSYIIKDDDDDDD